MNKETLDKLKRFVELYVKRNYLHNGYWTQIEVIHQVGTDLKVTYSYSKTYWDSTERVNKEIELSVWDLIIFAASAFT